MYCMCVWVFYHHLFQSGVCEGEILNRSLQPLGHRLDVLIGPELRYTYIRMEAQIRCHCWKTWKRLISAPFFRTMTA